MHTSGLSRLYCICVYVCLHVCVCACMYPCVTYVTIINKEKVTINLRMKRDMSGTGGMKGTDKVMQFYFNYK